MGHTRWTNPKERRGWGDTTRPGLCGVAVIVSLFAAVICLDVARDTRRPLPTPAPTQTPYVLEVVRLEFVPVTRTPRPYAMPTRTPEVEYRFPTPTPDLSATGKLEID